MTLCIAWRNKNAIKFASDSRISVSNSETAIDTDYADVAIKIMEVPVKIKNPTSYETGASEIIYDHSIGICYCGDTMNAHLIKEAIGEVLKNLQLLPTYTDFSLRGICRTIEKFVRHISDQLRNSIGWNPEIEFLVGGYCPERREVLVYNFQLVDYHDHYEIIVDEILQDEGEYYVMGSGKELAEEIIESNNVQAGKELLNVIKQVCLDDSVPSVGGYLQYGQFEYSNFKIFGVEDYEIGVDGELEYVYPYRGIVLYKGQFEMGEKDFHIGGTFIRPFEEEIDEYFKSRFNNLLGND